MTGSRFAAPAATSVQAVAIAHAPMAATAPVIRRQAEDPLGPQAAGRCTCGGGCPGCLAYAGIQPRLLVGSVDDPAEREADAVADTIADGAAPSHPDGLTAPQTDHAITAHPLLEDFRSSTGSPLDPQLRATLESAFGSDFRAVRIHTDPTAAASARSI